jgi:hypothetical protein
MVVVSRSYRRAAPGAREGTKENIMKARFFMLIAVAAPLAALMGGFRGN